MNKCHICKNEVDNPIIITKNWDNGWKRSYCNKCYDKVDFEGKLKKCGDIQC